MMNADAKARELTQHIQNPKTRERTFAGLRDFITDLDAIGRSDDEHAYGGNHKDASLIALEEKQRKRVETLRVLTQGPFIEDFIVSEIIEEKVEPEINRRHRYGYTRLMQAVVEHDIQTVKNCLSLGANQFIADNGGNTCEEKARKLGFDDIVAILKN
jgi:hypothetical protein